MFVPRPLVIVAIVARAGSPFSVTRPTWRVPGRSGSFASKAMRVESGDHDGRQHSNFPLVICTGLPPVDGITYSWSQPSRSLRNAIHLPSGDGCAPPAASPVKLQNFGSTSSCRTLGSPPDTSATYVIRFLKSADVRSNTNHFASIQRRPPNTPAVIVTAVGAPPIADTVMSCPGT